jgi:hypothetical protein
MLQRTRGFVPDIKGRFAPGRFGGNAGQGYAPLHCGDNVRQGDGVGASGQHMAAGNAPEAFHNPLGLQQAHDFLYELFRNAGTRRQLRSRCGHGVTLFRKAQQQVQGMASHSGNTHDKSLQSIGEFFC